MLLSPESFTWAKGFLPSGTWKTLVSLNNDAKMLSFVLPPTCPENAKVNCPSAQLVEIQEEPPAQEDSSPVRQPPSQVGSPIVDTSIRRSPRIRDKFDGFKQSSCTAKGCLACSAKPPTLSLSDIRNIGENSCMMAPGTITDEVLLKRSKKKAAIGGKITPRKTISKKVEKGKKQKDNTDGEEPKNA